MGFWLWSGCRLLNYTDTNQILEEIEKSIAENIRSNVREMLDKQNLVDFIDSIATFYEKMEILFAYFWRKVRRLCRL